MQDTFRSRYPGPYRAEETPGGYMVVAANGFALCYIYTYDTNWHAGKPVLTHAEGLALAKAIAERLSRD